MVPYEADYKKVPDIIRRRIPLPPCSRWRGWRATLFFPATPAIQEHGRE
ncbi:MAG TPA: hypothetical protein PLN32_09435 [Methanoregulaceae archaeon]|nr:hypothetical protein [Methanoregulaceae archaeon]